MHKILIELDNFESLEAASLTAEEIMDSGGIRYKGRDGAEQNATIGAVTVE